MGNAATTSKRHPIRKLRDKLGLSGVAMAREIGITHQRIYEIEHHGGGLRKDRALEVVGRWPRQCRELKITPFDLIG